FQGELGSALFSVLQSPNANHVFGNFGGPGMGQPGRLDAEDLVNFPTLLVDGFGGELVGLNRFGRSKGRLSVFGTGKDAGKGVIVRGRNWVILMIVAAGASHSQTQKTTRKGIDSVVQLVKLFLVTVIHGS